MVTAAQKNHMHGSLLTSKGAWKPELVISLLRIHKGRTPDVAAALGTTPGTMQKYIERHPECHPHVNSTRGAASGDHTRTAILNAIASTNGGTITQIATACDVDYENVQKHLARHPEIRKAQQVAREKVTDAAEQHHNTAVLVGDDKHVLFELKTRGKDRGYTERRESEVTSTHIHPIDQASTADLVAAIREARETHALDEPTVVDADFTVTDD